jgi:hypothetical protein
MDVPRVVLFVWQMNNEGRGWNLVPLYLKKMNNEVNAMHATQLQVVLIFSEVFLSFIALVNLAVIHICFHNVPFHSSYSDCHAI